VFALPNRGGNRGRKVGTQSTVTVLCQDRLKPAGGGIFSTDRENTLGVVRAGNGYKPRKRLRDRRVHNDSQNAMGCRSRDQVGQEKIKEKER